MSSSEQKQSGFTVTDRRSFTGTGDPQPEDAPPPAAQPAAPAAEPAPAAPAAAAAAPAADAARSLPPVDFTTFVLSLGSSALMHLGEVEHPQSGKPQRDLALAKHTIDLLSMIQTKTKGNLTGHEDKLLESLLFDLRLRYVSAAKPSSG
jgi:hypothetical protein